MEKVADFINTGCFREALARLCRLALKPVEDGRITLCDWEHHYSPSDDNLLLEFLESDEPGAVTSTHHNNSPLLLLQALDEYCHRIFGPDTTRTEDRINDGFGESKVLPIYPGFGGGKLKKQFGNLSCWLKHHRVIPLDNVYRMPVEVTDIPSGLKDWTASRFESTLRVYS
ncbi:MAG: hypothetical protein HGB20_08240 [Chlorobiaceae bacterium]|nr:hypothetical protein [Chlorobiaceae bacterium]